MAVLTGYGVGVDVVVYRRGERDGGEGGKEGGDGVKK